MTNFQEAKKKKAHELSRPMLRSMISRSEVQELMSDMGDWAYDYLYDFLACDEVMEEYKPRMVKDLEQKLKKATEALESIANEDFRGNRSSGSVKAYKALKEINNGKS